MNTTSAEGNGSNWTAIVHKRHYFHVFAQVVQHDFAVLMTV